MSASTGSSRQQEHLVGKDTNDKLYGGLGKDTLTGMGGLDIFVFNTKLDKSTRTRSPTSTCETIRFGSTTSIFKKLGGKGSEKNPAETQVVVLQDRDQGKDKDDYLIYNKSTGTLSYDADGSGKGKAVEFAVLKKNLALKYDDFAVI